MASMIFMVADLCHVVFTCFQGEKAKRRHAKTRQMVTFRVFAWRPFAPPHERTTLVMRRLFASCLSYLCLAGRKVTMRKHEKVTIWRVFAWRPFVCAFIYTLVAISRCCCLYSSRNSFVLMS